MRRCQYTFEVIEARRGPQSWLEENSFEVRKIRAAADDEIACIHIFGLDAGGIEDAADRVRRRDRHVVEIIEGRSREPPGDRVAVEEPHYFGFVLPLGARGIELVGIPI